MAKGGVRATQLVATIEPTAVISSARNNRAINTALVRSSTMRLRLPACPFAAILTAACLPKHEPVAVNSRSLGKKRPGQKNAVGSNPMPAPGAEKRATKRVPFSLSRANGAANAAVARIARRADESCSALAQREILPRRRETLRSIGRKSPVASSRADPPPLRRRTRRPRGRRGLALSIRLGGQSPWLAPS